MSRCPVPSRNSDSDFWSPSNGKFSLRATWDVLKPSHPEVPWHHLVWFKKNIPRYNFIAWLAVQERLNTKDRIHDPSVNSQCVLCRLDSESHGHLFADCPFSSNIWRVMLNKCGEPFHQISWAMFIDNRARYWKAVNKENWRKKITLTTVIYHLWRERNNRVFKNLYMDGRTIQQNIDREIAYRDFPL